MRHCGRCQRDKPASEFHRYGKSYQPWCKDCKREYAADYYQRNRERRVEYNRRQRAEAAAWYRGLKCGRRCADCGGVFEPAAMQWDHLPGFNKVSDVASMQNGSRERALEEIKKCELVCANCHAVRTFLRRTDERVASELASSDPC